MAEFMKSVKELSGLSTKIQAFECRIEDLQKHLDSIQNAIDTKFNRLTPQQQLKKSGELGSLPAIITETTADQRKTEPETAKNNGSELQHFCQTMCSRNLKRYICSHLSDVEKLRVEATSALKLAPKPAKLVLDCVGRFYLQGKKAYTKDSPMVSSRQGSIFVLEFFLGMIAESDKEIEIENSVKKDAETEAIAWKKRMITEGGVSKACEIDARGLLLFISCFGILKALRNEDVRDLIKVSNLTHIGHLLKKAPGFVAKISEIIEQMTKNGMHIEAVDMVYSFGMEDKFSPRAILTLFLRESKEAWSKTRRDPPLLQKKANEKYLAALKSVTKLMEQRKIDQAKLLPGWQIKEKIASLEKESANLNKQIMEDNMNPKRKVGEIESPNNLNVIDIKRSRYSAMGSSQMLSPRLLGFPDPRTANYADVKSSYNDLMPNLLDRGFSGHLSSYPTASALSHGYDAGPLPDLHDMKVGGGARMHAVGVKAGMSTGTGIYPSGSYASAPREMTVDKIGQITYGNDPHPNPSYVWHRGGDASYTDRLIGQSYAPPQSTNMGVNGLYRQSSSTIEHYAGVSDPASVVNRNLPSDLYSFADTIV